MKRRVESVPATRLVRVSALLCAALLGSSVLAQPGAHASSGTRVPGPPLTAESGDLAAALSCPEVAGRKPPVLLVHGTGANSEIAWSKGLQPLLSRRYDVCTLELPDAGNGRVDVAGQYVVAAIRTMAARFDRPVNLIGHSQGGMVLRWAVKWWPDLRSLVDDVIGLAPSNHGSPLVAQFCTAVCPAAYWQQGPGSRFLTALNKGDETPGRVNYSVVYSDTDSTVPPPSPIVRRDTGDSNTAVQDICPGREVSHTQILYDAVSVALVFDALTHSGPARASRVDRSFCDRTYAAGIEEAAAEQQQKFGDAYFAARYTSAQQVSAEPALPRYAGRRSPQPHALLLVRKRGAGSHTLVRFRALGGSGRERWPLPFARIAAAGHRTTTDSEGRATLRLDLGNGPVRVRLVARGLAPIVLWVY